MKKIFLYIMLLTFMLGEQSCSDLLEENPVSSVNSDYLNTVAGFEGGVKGAYSSLRDYYGREIGTNLTIFGTDTYTMGADGSYKFMNQYIASFGSNVDILRDLWNNLYVSINTMNILIDEAEAGTVTGLTDAIKAQRIAELKFLRAHHYFILVQNWGAIPLTLTGNKTAKKDFVRNSVPEVYASITADLEAALPNLPATTPATEYGRATKGACEHMLARVYLTKATSEAKAPDDYEKAEMYAQNVIKNYNYALLSDFAQVYDQSNQINSEVIFAVQYTSDALTDIFISQTGTSMNGNQTHLYFGMEYDTQSGMKRDIANGRPFKRYRPTNYLLNTVFNPADRSKDSRYKKTFKDTWYSNNPGKYTNVFDNSKSSVTFKAGDTTIFIPGVEWSQAKRASKPYQVLVPSLYKANLFPTLSKFLDPLRPDISTEWGSRDWFVARLAETYLILSEAQLMRGKVSEATATINVLRRRAAWPGKALDMEITPAQMTLEFIIEERERELAGEMFRWYDLKRWGLLVERVRKYNSDAAPSIQDYHQYRPIPQTQIDRTKGGADAFPQNPGY